VIEIVRKAVNMICGASAPPPAAETKPAVAQVPPGEVEPARLSQFAAFRPEVPGHTEIFLRDAAGLFEPTGDDDSHLDAALEWLLRSQQVTGTHGFSAGYSFADGWLPPYPETTGYTIVTLWEAFRLRKDGRFRQAAVQAAAWEHAIQMECGAIQAGYYGIDPAGLWDGKLVPAAFNTGQVVQGWNRTFLETKDPAYLDASIKACRYLESCVDEEGIFRQGLSPGPTNLIRSYYTRVAHALAWTGRLAGESSFEAAARRHLDWVLLQQRDNGWFAHAQFHSGENPLTHTMAYTAEGLLDAGLLLEENRYVDASFKHCLQAMHTCERRGFFLPASLDENWKSTDKYVCLTGNAQFATLWLRHGDRMHDLTLINAGLKMVDWLKGVQSLQSENPGIKGGIAGAWPIDGGYSMFRYLNWSTKFFADALMKARDVEDRLRSDG
jgi:hypothetical protein